jgi:polar amino acid transport system permease protein
VIDFLLSIQSLVQTWGGLLLRGAIETCRLFAMTLVLELTVAIVMGLARLSRITPIRVFANIFVEIFRGVSSYVTLFWLYFALPMIGISLGALEAAVFALALVHGAYASEYVRSTLLAVPKGQIDASIALNMTRFQRMRYVVFPQAIVAMMPLFGNDAIMLLKATSLASLIAVPELTEAGLAINGTTYSANAFAVFTILLIVYFVLSQAVALAMRMIEARVAHWKFPNRVSPFKTLKMLVSR